MLTLETLAAHLGAQLVGDAQHTVDSVATLAHAQAHQLTFLANRKYAALLNTTQAGVVIVAPNDAPTYAGNRLIVNNPYSAYSKAAALLHPQPKPAQGVHPKAWIADDVVLGEQVSIDVGAVVQSGAVIGRGSVIGANAVIGYGVRIGNDCIIGANVTILHHCQLGNEVTVESGTVIGSEGFGWAKEGDCWLKVPQLGRVIIGNQVSIGANVCIDRGAIEDTVIEDDVKIDNLIQIAHNVRIGEHTAMAAGVGISGSTTVGRRCTLAGKVGLAGHLTIGDDVHITGMTLVTRSLTQAGVYSGNLPVEDNASWRKNIARFRQIDAMAKRLKQLEKHYLAQEEVQKTS